MNIKRWIKANCKFARNQKLASVSLYVADYQQPKEAKTTFELSWDIASPLINAMQKMIPPETFKQWRQSTSPEFFTIDGFDTNATEGLLNFYVPNLNMELIQKLLPVISYYAKEFGGEIGRPIFETYKQKLQTLENEGNEQLPHYVEQFKGKENEIRVVRFPAKILPPKEIEDRPPELNLSNGNARFIFQDVLNFSNNQLDPPWIFEASDLLIKINAARNGMIQNRVQEENKEREEMNSSGKGVTIFNTPVDEHYVEDILQRIEAVARWALSHNYSSIEAV